MDENKNQKGSPFNFNNRFALIFLAGLILFFALFFFLIEQGDGATRMPYSTFFSYLTEGQIDTVKILDYHEIEGSLRGADYGMGRTFRTEIPYPDEDLMPLLRENGVVIQGGRKSPSFLAILIQSVPWLIGFFLIWFMFRQVQGGGSKAFSFGKSRAKQYLENDAKKTFNDVAGQHEAKYELQEVVDFLKNPHKFTKIGARIPTGVLLVGMPGNRKNTTCKGMCRRSRSSVLPYVRIGFCRDVCRCRGKPGP